MPPLRVARRYDVLLRFQRDSFYLMTSVFRAKAVWVRGQELELERAVIVDDGLVQGIVALAEAPRDAQCHDVDFLLPGFINAHAHLAYGALRGQLTRGADFVDWLREINAANRNLSDADYRNATIAAVPELLAGGCTTVVDSVLKATVGALVGMPIRHFQFRELIAFSDEDAKTRMADAECDLEQTRLAVASGDGRCLGMGLNPHAPYTVGSGLRKLLREKLAQQPDLKCAWHLQEFPDETKFFATGRGRLADMFSSFALPFPFDEVPGCWPFEFLKREGLIDRCDVAFHLNDFQKQEALLFKAPRLIVHCPGTHEFFARSQFRATELIEDGANLAIGTDSLASCDTLNIFELMRRFAYRQPGLTGPQLINVLTRNPGEASILADTSVRLGVIDEGAAADLVCLGSSLSSAHDLRDVLLAPETFIAGTFIAGRQVFKA